MSAPTTTQASDTCSPPSLVEQLLLELEQLPASRAVALRVVQVIDDPATGAAEAAAAISADPALTARILRVANSVYYGLSGRVANPSFAITVVGFSTVRSLAVVGAAGLAGSDAFPPGFWMRSAAVASGASLVARRCGAVAPEAFSAGLLHDLGSALLRQYDRAGYDALLLRAALGGEPVPAAELRLYGATAASLCAQVLSAWHFPQPLCEAIARRHDLADRKGPALVRALHAGAALADMAGPLGAQGRAVGAALAAAGVRPEEAAGMVGQVREAAAQLAATFNE